MTDLTVLAIIALISFVGILILGCIGIESKRSKIMTILLVAIGYGTSMVYLILFTIQTVSEIYVDKLSQ